jgi:hypothetical protein
VLGAAVGVLVFILIAGAGILLAATMQVRRLPEFVLAAYLLGYATVVALCLSLSVFGAMARPVLVAGAVVIFGVALAVWLSQGAPRPPKISAPAARVLVSRRPVLLLGVVAVLALVYVAALILGTPPNGSDQLNYQLPRAVLWLEADRVGYVHDAYDQRINSFAPNGEIGVAFALDVTRNEIFAAFVQFAAALACAVGVFALGRRLRLSDVEAAFGALLFLTLPIVLLQAASTKNDVVVASFLVAAAAFLLGETRGHLALAGLTTALAVGTKFTAFYGIVILGMLALLASTRRERVLRLATLAGGTIAGSYWYVLNIVETGRVFGDTSAFRGLTSVFSPRENLYSLVGLALDSIDVSGARGADILLYPAAALVAGVCLALTGRRSRSREWIGVAVAMALIASPVLLHVLAVDLGKPLLVRVLHGLGNPPAYIPPSGNPTLSPTLASDTGSWFGPVGFVLALGVAAGVLLLVRRGAIPRVAELFALAPLAWVVLVGSSLTYLPWQGRFFLFPMALSASLWGSLLRAPQVAWAAAVLGAVTASLTLVHYAEKPSGLRLVDRDPVQSVWGMSRWQAQSLELHPPPIGQELRFIQEHVPPDESIALAIGDNDYGYPMFDPHFRRHVGLVPFGSSAAQFQSEWLVANPVRAPEIDTSCWRAMFRSQAGTVFRRAARC